MSFIPYQMIAKEKEDYMSMNLGALQESLFFFKQVTTELVLATLMSLTQNSLLQLKTKT